MADSHLSYGGPLARGESVDAARLRRAAWAYTTRRVPRSVAHHTLPDVTPSAGDLALVRIDAIAYHSALQLPNGRRKHLFVGDEAIVVFGNRYAPNQFEAIVPQTLGPCHLVASGGVAAKARSWHSRISKGPTRITPIGAVADASGKVVNLADFALHTADGLPDHSPPAVAVVGTAMDAGKTQTCAYLVRGLIRSGARVGYAKVTGTGAGGDAWLLKDAGAEPVLDFTDVGHVSTSLLSSADVESIFVTLLAHLARSGVDAMVLEVADGVLQRETAALLASKPFKQAVTAVLFAAGDAMGALAGHAWLTRHGLPVAGLSGVLTAAPLQARESAQATGLPVYSRSDLARPRTALDIITLAGIRNGGRIDSRLEAP